jgi:hypothetical protein
MDPPRRSRGARGANLLISAHIVNNILEGIFRERFSRFVEYADIAVV